MRKLLFILVALQTLLAYAGELQHGDLKIKYTVEEADEWTELFKRTSGWTGADGIFSYDDKASGKKVFVFSDTWIGEVDPQSRQRKTMKMINNSMAALQGDKPSPDQIEFFWDKEKNSTPFKPADKGWYWLQDGFIHNGYFYNFPMRILKNPKGSEGFQFRTAAVDILKIPLKNGQPQFTQTKQIDMKLYTKVEKRELYYGAGVMKNAGDGYIYIYGRFHKPFQIHLVVARVKPEEVENKDAWRFWNGKNWDKDIDKSASLGEGGPELSVTKMESGPLRGKYLLCSMPISREVFVRIGDSPVGPFGQRQVIYKTPTQDQIEGIYTYNAKAHPVLSKDGELLISYNVNATKLGLHKNAEIYRPRFIWLKFK